MRFKLRAVYAVAVLLVAPAACWYDSTWGQTKAAQQHLAAKVTPGPIAPSSTVTASAPRRTYRVRLRPDPHYLSQTVDAERQLEQLVEDSDRVLAENVGLHLEVESIRPWSFDADEHLRDALQALEKDDAGDDVDVVVGLIGALPRPTESLHELGMAEVLGKHVALRAASRIGEYDAVDRAMGELSQDDRARVVRARRRHRAEAVFLHELGHVLGALHEDDATSLMNPAYDEKMANFGSDAVILMRLALDEPDRPAVMHAQLDYLRAAKTHAWPEAERQEEVARLQALTAPPPDAGSLAAPTPAASASFPPELAATDGERFLRATQLFQAGAAAAAYKTAAPLFAAYPDTFAVQDLRCQLATLRFLGKEALLAECAPSMRLADGGASAASR